ncbi:MAG: polymerase, sigma-24 subunit, subfamily [Verrucomicrobia bacterium]|nr:polymerase, sigma-24 subunit, subfamily [Verrucomicrobiota bacterium]
MSEDSELLRRYAHERSEAAFAELVRRHVNLVYSAALRQANGDAHLAQDATQIVFTDLARKAGSLAGRAVLAGWLFTSTRFAVSKLVRGERRRQAREQEAQLMNETHDDPAAKLDWAQVRSVLDEALAGLAEADREAVLMRFFEGRDFAGVGARLKLSENAARMRVDRALDKLHAQLSRRGVTSSTAALAAVLANQAVVAAPAGLAASVTGAALAGGSTAGAATAIAAFMTMNKMTMGMAGTLVLAGSTGYMLQARTATKLRAELESVRTATAQVETLRSENLELAKTAAEVAAMRTDDATLAQLNDEAEALKVRMERAARLTAAGASANANRMVYEPRGLDRMPTAKTRVGPQWPAALRQSVTEGEVVVDFVVDASGVVRNAYAARSTMRDLESAAVEAVAQWTFDPGQKGGRLVNTHMQVALVLRPAPNQSVVGTPTPYVPEKKPLN